MINKENQPNTATKVLEEIQDAVYQYQKTGFLEDLEIYLDAAKFLEQIQNECHHLRTSVTVKALYCLDCLSEINHDQDGDYDQELQGYHYKLVIVDRGIPRLDVLKKENK